MVNSSPDSITALWCVLHLTLNHQKFWAVDPLPCKKPRRHAWGILVFPVPSWGCSLAAGPRDSPTAPIGHRGFRLSQHEDWYMSHMYTYIYICHVFLWGSWSLWISEPRDANGINLQFWCSVTRGEQVPFLLTPQESQSLFRPGNLQTILEYQISCVPIYNHTYIYIYVYIYIYLCYICHKY